MPKLILSNTTMLFSVVLTLMFGALQCGYHAPPEYARIFDLPPAQEREEYRKLPLEKQVDMYSYAMSREPPAIGYIDLLASNGEKVIPYLLARLAQEERDYARADLIAVFERMHEKYYDLRSQDGIIENLKTESAKIKNEHWRAQSEKYISSILSK